MMLLMQSAIKDVTDMIMYGIVNITIPPILAMQILVMM
jgi:hypothetical protein